MTAALQVLGSVIAAALAVLGVIYTARQGRVSADRAQDSDESRAALEAWRELLAPYRAEVAELRDEVAQLRREQRLNRTWRLLALEYMRKLYRHVLALGGDPIPPPPELDFDPPARSPREYVGE